ncbi:hypothetical protein [Lentzea cavernae]|uniref:Uncharacterized protein n=1 Tax=Lentzea cavernae TaxID=2020703 RepID=A0ABQ3M6P9_9PSEU|nr:hypothetical protein [Lentzea cavernae]GHH34347.1 hypothetical protein GCM10017774_18210 [Lentzea cavernae]
MTDWSVLHHAYGTAEDVPGLLARAAANDREAWTELWSALCHQGTSYPASYAALPHLADMANVDAVLLAAGILADGGDDEVRAEHAASITRLSKTANAVLPDTDEDAYTYVLESVLVLEGVLDQADVLSWGMTDQEYEVECPECDTPMFVVVDEGVSRTEEGGERPLRPADPAALEGLGRRVWETATAHGKEKVAHTFRYVFGQATCPECDTGFTVSEVLL